MIGGGGGGGGSSRRKRRRRTAIIFINFHYPTFTYTKFIVFPVSYCDSSGLVCVCVCVSFFQ